MCGNPFASAPSPAPIPQAPAQPRPVTVVNPQQYGNSSPDFEMGIEEKPTAAQDAQRRRLGKNKLKVRRKKDPAIQTGGSQGSGSGLNVTQ